MDKDLLEKFNKVEQFHWWWAGRQKLIKNLLTPHQPKKILDIGCGTGETLTFLKSVFPKAIMHGIDILPEAVAFTKSRGHTAIRGDVYRLPYKNAEFDTVLLLDVIEHLKDDNKVIIEAKRVLKSGGVIIITAPALPFIWSDHDKNQGHFRRYTRRRFRELAINNDLKVEFLSYFNFFLSPIIIVIRLLSNLSLFNSLGQYDSKLNYNIAHKKMFNSILRRLFVFEVNLLRFVNLPFGISVAVEMVK